jgi:hypothetical protein
LQAISFFKSIITLESHLFINIFMNSIRISFAITAFYENGTIHGIMLLSSTREEMVRSCQSKEALRFFYGYLILLHQYCLPAYTFGLRSHELGIWLHFLLLPHLAHVEFNIYIYIYIYILLIVGVRVSCVHLD